MKNLFEGIHIKNLKIGKKLAIPFFIVLLISSVASGNALYNLKKSGEMSKVLFEDSYKFTNQTMGIRMDIVSISRAINGSFADNDHLSQRPTILESFDSATEKIKSIKQSGVENEIINKEINDIENSIIDLKQEYEKIYMTTQQEGFSGLLKDINTADYSKAFGEATESANILYEDANSNANILYEKIQNAVSRSQIIATSLNIFSFIGGVMMCIAITKRLKQPIEEIEIAANKMAKGDFDINIDYESEDELGMLADTMRQMSEKTKAIINDTVDVLEEVASGNFDVLPQAEYMGVFKTIENSVIKITNDLSDTMTQINAASEEVGAASDQVASGAQMLSQGTTEQASAIEELSSTIMEISKKIKETASNASEANVLSLSAGSEVKDGNEQMKQMVNAMEEISFTSNEIGRIIKTIDDIAFQTNILALNAAVEAARAGEAGKGFAVVADEVRNLAAKSAEAAKNTATLIENSIRAVDNGTKIVDNTAQSLQRIIDTTNQTIILVDEIAKASDEQANSIAQVTVGVEQISEVVQTNSATSEESAAASEELSGQAQMLKSLIDNFKLKDKQSFHKSINFNDDEINYFDMNESK